MTRKQIQTDLRYIYSIIEWILLNDKQIRYDFKEYSDCNSKTLFVLSLYLESLDIDYKKYIYEVYRTQKIRRYKTFDTSSIKKFKNNSKNIETKSYSLQINWKNLDTEFYSVLESMKKHWQKRQGFYKHKSTLIHG